jgi:ribosome-associated protein
MVGRRTGRQGGAIASTGLGGRSKPRAGCRNVGCVEEIAVGPTGIRLGQLLKLVGAVDTGGQARSLLDDGTVSVNGEVESRRGRQLAVGDVVRVPGRELRLT